MVANLILKDGYYYCSECRMRQSQLYPLCSFCESQFTNYQEMIVKKLMEDENESRILGRGRNKVGIQ